VTAGGAAPPLRIVLAHARDDQQCPVELAEKLRERWGVRLVTFDTGGHGLGKDARCLEISELIRQIFLPSQARGVPPVK